MIRRPLPAGTRRHLGASCSNRENTYPFVGNPSTSLRTGPSTCSGQALRRFGLSVSKPDCPHFDKPVLSDRPPFDPLRANGTTGEYVSELMKRSITRSTLRIVLAAAAFLCLLAPSLLMAGDAETNVVLHAIPREILFFSAQAGQWTSVRLDAGERLLQRGADGNVAAVVTSQRAIGFSAPLNATHEIRLPDDESLEAFKVEGNIATLLTRRRAIGFSAATGKWADLDRFQLGR